MGLSSALNTAYTGLAVSTLRTNVAANNIANASTDGYVRRSLDVTSIALDGFGAGVRAEGVSLATNPALTADRREADAAAGGAQVLAEGTEVLARLIGDPSDPGAMTERYTRLETSLRALAEDPGKSFLQTDVLNSAEFVLDGFHDMQRDVLDLREDADRQIAELIHDANLVLEQIATLNELIRKTNSINGDIGEMKAERGRLIDQITETFPVRVYENDFGAVLLTTETGHTLVGDAGYNEIQFTQANVIDPTSDLASGDLSGITIAGIDLTPPASTALTDGRLYSLFQLRDVTTVEFQGQIDGLAQDLINRFEDVDVTAEGLFIDAGNNDGAPGTAGRIAVNAAVDPDQSGLLTRLRDGIGATAVGETGNNQHAQRLLEAMTDTRAYATNIAGNVFVSSADGAITSGATLYTAATTVADQTGLTPVYSLTDDAGGTFVIDATTGAVTLAPAQTLTAGVDYKVTIQALAGHNAVLHTSTSAGAGITHTLTNDAGGLFEIDAATGEVSLVAGQTIDFETATSFNIQITSTDGVTPVVQNVTLTAEQIRTATGVTVETETVAISTDNTVGPVGRYDAHDLVSALTSILSTNSVNAAQESTLRTTYRDLLETQEISETGVNLDFELGQLNEIQTAYAANARVVQVIDELMQILMEI
ncbi:MAG: flagellar basal body rod C-terminal domain-containing protein [Pseudomonadota bacterium]